LKLLAQGNHFSGFGFVVREGPVLVAETVEEPLAAGKIILVAEDEVLIRLDISDYLRARGYAVIETNSAAEAIQVLKSDDLEVAVVFTDIRMPGTVDGMDLTRYVQSHHPHIPVVVTSGHVSSKEVDSLGVPFVAKPYDRAKVLGTIEQQLRQREGK
jgi:DNA-binding NtrC family response regulator